MIRIAAPAVGASRWTAISYIMLSTSGVVLGIAAVIGLLVLCRQHMQRVHDLESALQSTHEERGVSRRSLKKGRRPEPTSKMRRGRQLVPSEDPMGDSDEDVDAVEVTPSAVATSPRFEAELHVTSRNGKTTHSSTAIVPHNDADSCDGLAWGGSGRSLVNVPHARGQQSRPSAPRAPKRPPDGKAVERRDRDGWTQAERSAKAAALRSRTSWDE